MSWIASSGEHRPLAQRPAQVLLVIPLRSPRLTNSFTQSPGAAFPRRRGVRLRPRPSRRSRSAAASRRGAGACSSRSSGLSHSPIEVFTSRSIRSISSRCAGVTKVIARPVRPTRPVRPIRCT